MPPNYSHSALKAFDQCPRKYKFQYIEKPDITKFVSAHTALGQVVHLVLQRVYATARDLIPITEEQAIAFYHKSWQEYKYLPNLKVSDSHYGVDDYIKMGEKMLRDYYASFHPFQDGILLGAELQLSFTIPDSTYRCSARVDRLWKREDGVVEIWDYKTGSRLPQVSDPTFRHQMGLYQLAVAAQHPQFTDIELVQYYLPLKEAVRYRMSSDELEEIAAMLRNEIAMIREAIRLDSFPTQETALCSWCEYFELCPAKRHRVMLEAEEEDTRPLAVRLSDLTERYLQAYHAEKKSKAELDRLKLELIEAAKEHGLSNLVGQTEQVKVSIATKAKFITKTDDPTAYAELNELARQLGLDAYLELNTNEALKNLYTMEQMGPEVKAQLGRFVVLREDSRVSPPKKRTASQNGDDEE